MADFEFSFASNLRDEPDANCFNAFDSALSPPWITSQSCSWPQSSMATDWQFFWEDIVLRIYKQVGPSR